MTSKDTRNAISSPGWADGLSRPDLPDGPMTARSGPHPAHVSRSAPQEKAKERMTQGICGRTYFDSSAPAGPTTLWASRLAERLATVGSTESALIWRRKDTPAKRSIFRLAPSTRRTNGTGCIGSHWSTARASDGEKGGPNMSFGAGGQPLPAQMAQTYWVTASARDWKDSAGMATQAGERSRLDQLPRQMAAMAVAYSPTPTLHGNYNRRGSSENSGDGLATVLRGICRDAMALSGPPPNGSPATTEKRGAPNPVFACWLMGWSDELISGVSRATESFSLSRRKRSRR